MSRGAVGGIGGGGVRVAMGVGGVNGVNTVEEVKRLAGRDRDSDMIGISRCCRCGVSVVVARSRRGGGAEGGVTLKIGVGLAPRGRLVKNERKVPGWEIPFPVRLPPC